MKRNLFFLLLLITSSVRTNILYIAPTVIHQEMKEQEPTLDSVLNNYFVAVAGSKERLEQITSLISEGEISFSQISEKATIVNKYKFPNKYISKVSIMGQIVIQGFDGVKSFSNMPTMSEDQSKELQNRKGIFSELYYTDKEAVLKGKEKLSGKEVYKIIVTEDNMKTVVYFDLKSGLKVKEEIIREKETVVKEYLEYKDFGGYKLSTKTITKVPGQVATQIIKKYEINSVFSDAEFKL